MSDEAASTTDGMPQAPDASPRVSRSRSSFTSTSAFRNNNSTQQESSGMSGSVTPARRSRDESDDGEEEDFEVSVDGESPPRSNRSKRARLSDDDVVEAEEGDENGEAPILPDSFRRSPKGKRRAVNGLTNGSGRPKTHQPGSIVRVTVTDFVTYTSAEFNPGPNLNMVIGPNGTGKSTLVCAICIGLGWATRHLGRGKDLDEFVKHGAKRGQIEIELAADPERHDKNPVITTKIKKDDKGKAEYFIDGKKEKKKRVQELARSFSIQVDNLCQFLPQDRVVEFANLSPEDLLTQTQHAAAPDYMTDWHDQLKGWRKEQKACQTEQQGLAETLKKQEERHRNQQEDVKRLRDRAGLQHRLTALEKMRVLPEYRSAKEKFLSAKAEKKVAEKEYNQLHRRMEPNLAAVTDKKQYLDNVKAAVDAQRRKVERTEAFVTLQKKEIDASVEKIKERDNELESERKSMKDVRLSVPGLQREVTRIQKAMETLPATFDTAEMNAQVREKNGQIHALDNRIDEARQDVGSLEQQARQRQTIIQNAEREKERMQSQVGQQMDKVQGFSRDAARAWEWIQTNRHRFQTDVYGPPLVECRVKEDRHAPAVESMLQESDALAFTVTSKADFDMLTDQLYQTLKLRQVSVRASLKGLDAFRSPASAEALQQYGLQGWVLDLLEGPEPVLAMLCDNKNIHQAAYTMQEISQPQFDALQQSPISSWVTAKQSYVISRRREYGDKATSTRVQDLRPARFFTQHTVDHEQESNIDRGIAKAQSEIDELKESQRAKNVEVQEMQKQKGQLEQEKAGMEADKSAKQKAMSQFNALPTKLAHADNKLREAREKLAGSSQRKREIVQKCDAIYLEKGQNAINYANAVESLRAMHLQRLEAEILLIEASSDHQQLKDQRQDEERLLNEKRQQYQQLDAWAKELLANGQRWRDACQDISAELSPEEHEIWEEIQDWDLDQWQTEVISVRARLESLMGGGNDNTLREFEARARDIETKTMKFHELASTLDELEAQITDVRKKWEPELDELVGEISGAFAENFSKIQCVGEVGVHKDEDFENWAIQIKVKFRENEPLSLLDSHRQSGGERAVSTIFYLMALQSLARAPFRVVDEINQGMDPRNERLVHSRMVDIACAEASMGRQGSQYFLITPKLLQGLRYHPDMKVHCIASGEHMPGDFREIDFRAAAERALELRGRGVGVAAG